MRRILSLCFFLVLSCVSAGFAQQNSQWRLDASVSRVTFVLSSTLHDAAGVVNDASGFLNWDEKSVISGEGVFKVLSMKTGNGARDQKMYRMFDAEHFSEIIYRFDKVLIPEASESRLDLHGVLTIKNTSREQLVPLAVLRNEDVVTLSGETEVSLKNFGLEAPGVLGMIKVKDIVKVKFQMVYRRQG